MTALLAALLLPLSLLLGVGGLFLIALGLPGNWILAAAALVGPICGLGWQPFLILLGLAVLAEIGEFFVGARWTRRAGGGRASMWMGLFGGFLGAILLTPVFPIPVLGSLLGAALGAAAGAILGEALFAREEAKALWRIGLGAFLGTLFGKGFKLFLGLIQLSYWAFETTRVVQEKLALS